MLQEIMLGLEQEQGRIEAVFNNNFPELDLQSNCAADIEMVKLSSAGEAVTNTATALAQLEMLAGEAMGPAEIDLLLTATNQSLSIIGVEAVKDSDKPKESIGKKIKVLWAKVKVILAKLIQNAKKTLRKFFNNMFTMERKHLKALEFMYTLRSKTAKNGTIDISDVESLSSIEHDRPLEGLELKEMLNKLEAIPKALDKIGSEFKVVDGKISLPSAKEISTILDGKLTAPEEKKFNPPNPEDYAFSHQLSGHFRLGYLFSESSGDKPKFIIKLHKIVPVPTRRVAIYTPEDLNKYAEGRLEAGLEIIKTIRVFEDLAGKNISDLNELVKRLSKDSGDDAASITATQKVITDIISVITAIIKHLFKVIEDNYKLAKRMAAKINAISIRPPIKSKE